MEAQGGTFSIYLDGDLFRVTIGFQRAELSFDEISTWLLAYLPSFLGEDTPKKQRIYGSKFSAFASNILDGEKKGDIL